MTSLDEGRIHWNAKARALVEPHQRSPGSSAARAPDIEAVVATIKGVLAQRSGYIRQAFSHADARLQPLTQAVLDSLDQPASEWLKNSPRAGC